ncbi:UNKNOWN [Stylonychia lemnae]|uniref:HMG box domain-containing protein n=1 Tax=Stylonychia lemnae TaxID=5949 RepID=A0A078BE41_STYLE|nr:UNKNOWN [Stylonychia lemnae]|eukprot:CDW91412.1 UNKNOWN [Stylonychia lemnae]
MTEIIDNRLSEFEDIHHQNPVEAPTVDEHSEDQQAIGLPEENLNANNPEQAEDAEQERQNDQLDQDIEEAEEYDQDQNDQEMEDEEEQMMNLQNGSNYRDLEENFEQISLEQQQKFAQQYYQSEDQEDEFGDHLKPINEEELEQQKEQERQRLQQQQQLALQSQRQQQQQQAQINNPEDSSRLQQNSSFNQTKNVSASDYQRQQQSYNQQIQNQQQQTNQSDVSGQTTSNSTQQVNSHLQLSQINQQDLEKKLNENYKAFCHHKYQEIVAKYPQLVSDSEQIATIIAKEWHSLPSDQKLNLKIIQVQSQRPQQVAQQQISPSQQLLQQQMTQSNPYHQAQIMPGISGIQMKVKKFRRTKAELESAAEKPKKCMTPYLYFVKQNRARIGQENPGRSFKDMMQLISQIWARMTPQEKIPYDQMAAHDKIRHESEMRDYQVNVIEKGMKPIKKQRKVRGLGKLALMGGQVMPVKAKSIVPSMLVGSQPIQQIQQSQPQIGNNQYANVVTLYSMIQQQNQIINMLLTQQTQLQSNKDHNSNQNQHHQQLQQQNAQLQQQHQQSMIAQNQNGNLSVSLNQSAAVPNINGNSGTLSNNPGGGCGQNIGGNTGVFGGQLNNLINQYQQV